MDYKSVNKELWNNWTKLHLESAFYDMESFRPGSPL